MRLSASDLERLPDLVRDTREQRAQSYRDVAAETGLTVATVHLVEHGTVSPRLTTVLRLVPWLERRTTPAERRTADRIAGHA